jgi:hypothetical protein
MELKKTTPIVREALLARCIIEWSNKNGEMEMIQRASELLFSSIWDRLTADEVGEFHAIVEKAIFEDIREGKIPLSNFGPN